MCDSCPKEGRHSTIKPTLPNQEVLFGNLAVLKNKLPRICRPVSELFYLARHLKSWGVLFDYKETDTFSLFALIRISSNDCEISHAAVCDPRSEERRVGKECR